MLSHVVNLLMYMDKTMSYVYLIIISIWLMIAIHPVTELFFDNNNITRTSWFHKNISRIYSYSFITRMFQEPVPFTFQEQARFVRIFEYFTIRIFLEFIPFISRTDSIHKNISWTRSLHDNSNSRTSSL